MTETRTLEIRTPEGEYIDIEVEELNSIEQMRWAGKVPSSLKEGDPENIETGPELIEFCIELAEERTILTEELMADLDQSELVRTINGIVAYSFGEDTFTGEDRTTAQDFKMSDDSSLFNDDGSVDLDDWR
jgi:hypothetical protein